MGVERRRVRRAWIVATQKKNPPPRGSHARAQRALRCSRLDVPWRGVQKGRKLVTVRNEGRGRARYGAAAPETNKRVCPQKHKSGPPTRALKIYTSAAISIRRRRQASASLPLHPPSFSQPETNSPRHIRLKRKLPSHRSFFLSPSPSNSNVVHTHFTRLLVIVAAPVGRVALGDVDVPALVWASAAMITSSAHRSAGRTWGPAGASPAAAAPSAWPAVGR